VIEKMAKAREECEEKMGRWDNIKDGMIAKIRF
jgi:hypothetical protein